jgi:hypothetical protein
MESAIIRASRPSFQAEQTSFRYRSRMSLPCMVSHGRMTSDSCPRITALHNRRHSTRRGLPHSSITIAWAEPRNLMWCSCCERHGLNHKYAFGYVSTRSLVVGRDFVATFAREDRFPIILRPIYSLRESFSTPLDWFKTTGAYLCKVELSSMTCNPSMLHCLGLIIQWILCDLEHLCLHSIELIESCREDFFRG